MFKIILFLISIQFTISCTQYSGKKFGKIKNGRVDLSSWDFNKDGPIKLSGEWEFYFNKLITPKEYLEEYISEKNKSYFKVPSKWKERDKYPASKGITNSGYATYVLRVENFDYNKFDKLELKMPFVPTSYRAYYVPLDDSVAASDVKPFLSSGVVSKNRDESIAFYSIKIGTLKKKSKSNLIIIHVSNYLNYKGGITKSIYLGASGILSRARWAEMLESGIVFGVLLMMAFYHLALFIHRREDKASLIFGLYCFSVFGYGSALTYFPYEHIIKPSNHTFEIYNNVKYIPIYLGPMLMCVFLGIVFPKESRGPFYRTFYRASTFFIFLALFTSVEVYSKLHRIYQVILFLALIAVIKSVSKAIARKREGSILILVGFILMAYTVVHDLLVSNMIIQAPYFVHYGLVLFIFFQSFVLSKLFSNAFRTAEHLSENLKKEVSLQTVELEKKNVELLELDKQKTRFFQNISHELRTPLTLILNPIDDACRRYDDDNLKMASKNSRRLLRLVNQLLDFQKVSSGKKEVKLIPINLNEFLESIASYFQDSCKLKKIKFELEILTQNALTIRGEIDALEKIVFNYLANALKYTKENGTIKLRLREVEGSARISVRDSGMGIKDEDQVKLFKVFSQVDDASAREFEGTGLGLALVKELVSALHGMVGVRSTFGKGSTFFAEFPLYSVKDEVGETESVLKDYKPKDWHLVGTSEHEDRKPSVDISAISDGVKGNTVLVIDDLKDMRDLVSGLLQKSGYKTLTANNGKEGYEVAQKHSPDIIIVDWMMPEMTGIEFINKIQEDDNLFGTPTVLLTAKTDSESMMLGKIEGASAYIGKPFDEVELLSTVKNLIKLKLRERDLEELLIYKQKMAEIGELMPVITHEIKNAIGMTAGPIDIIMDGCDNFKYLNLIEMKDDLWIPFLKSQFSKSVSFDKKSERGDLFVTPECSSDKARNLKILKSQLAWLDIDDGVLAEIWDFFVNLEDSKLAEMQAVLNLLEDYSFYVRSSVELKRIVKSVLDYGRENDEMKNVEVRELVNSCAQLNMKKIKQGKIDFSNDIDAGLMVMLNASDIQQVVLNLITNAVDALADKGPDEKKLNVFYSNDAGDHLFLFENNGPPISPENIEKIFNKNFSTKGDKGNGIGLYICKKLVEKNNGTLSVESTIEKTTFKIRINEEARKQLAA